MMRLKLLGRCVMALLLLVSSSHTALAQGSAAEAVKKADKSSTPEPDGTTALHRAAYSDDLKRVDLLIRAGANAKAANRYGVTPLSLACVNGNAIMIETLLKAGADPNAASPEGETPLMLAARTGVAAAVNTLIAHGAAVNAKEKWRGQTALMWAAAEGHVAVIQALVDAGADVQTRSNGGLTPFLFAVREGQIGALRVLLARGANVNETLVGGGSGRRPPAAAAGQAAPPARGPSALVLAVANAHFELAAVLLDEGADPNAAPQGWTALHELTWVRKPGQGSNDPAPAGSGSMDSLEMVRRLAAHGADLNALASGRRRETVMTHLNLNGGTPFFFAARTGDAELMRLLVSLGADPLLPNEDNTTPLMAAAGVDARSPGEDAGSEPEAIEAIGVALELGDDINAADNNGNTAMHGAAIKQMPAVVKLLVEKGADIDIWNQENRSGWTPLRIAAGVWRAGNFRFDVATTKAIQEVMTAAGVSTKLEAATTVTSAIPAK